MVCNQIKQKGDKSKPWLHVTINAQPSPGSPGGLRRGEGARAALSELQWGSSPSPVVPLSCWPAMPGPGHRQAPTSTLVEGIPVCSHLIFP